MKKLFFIFAAALICPLAMYGSAKDLKEKSDNKKSTAIYASPTNNSSLAAAAASPSSAAAAASAVAAVSNSWTLSNYLSMERAIFKLKIEVPYTCARECREAYKAMRGTSQEKELLDRLALLKKNKTNVQIAEDFKIKEAELQFVNGLDLIWSIDVTDWDKL